MARSSALKVFALSSVASLTIGCAEPPVEGEENPPPETVETAKQELRVLGGLDLHTQCRRQHGSSAFAVLLQPIFSPGAAYAWRCRTWTDHHIDMQLFCKWQYNNSWAAASFTDFNNGYSWYCYLP